MSRLCSSEEKFDQHKDFYEESLRRSGYDTNLTYQPPEVNRPNKKKRRRWAKMVWYNPPWSMNVKTNVAKKFFKVIRQKFQEGCSPVNHWATTRGKRGNPVGKTLQQTHLQGILLMHEKLGLKNSSTQQQSPQGEGEH